MVERTELAGRLDVGRDATVLVDARLDRHKRPMEKIKRRGRGRKRQGAGVDIRITKPSEQRTPQQLANNNERQSHL